MDISACAPEPLEAPMLAGVWGFNAWDSTKGEEPKSEFVAWQWYLYLTHEKAKKAYAYANIKLYVPPPEEISHIIGKMAAERYAFMLKRSRSKAIPMTVDCDFLQDPCVPVKVPINPKLLNEDIWKKIELRRSPIFSTGLSTSVVQVYPR